MTGADLAEHDRLLAAWRASWRPADDPRPVTLAGHRALVDYEAWLTANGAALVAELRLARDQLAAAELRSARPPE